jgi:AmmeMemoRadiSam system protein A
MNPYCQLAKQATESYIRKGKEAPDISDLPTDQLPKRLLREKGGIFVTIKKGGKLRGCIGTTKPSQENLAKEIVFNAIAAATRDPRFESVSEEELSELTYTVYILHEPRKVSDLKELDPEKYGLIVKAYPKGNEHRTLKQEEPQKKGLLLPEIEEIETPHEQLDAVCEKSGIDPDKQALELFRFEAEKYEEKTETEKEQ